MPVERSPEGQRVQAAEPERQDVNHPALATLRGRRTRAKNALQTEHLALQGVERITEQNRLEILSARSRIAGRTEIIREVNNRIASHPLLPEKDVDREVDEAEDALATCLSVTATIDALIALQDFEGTNKPDTDSASSAPTSERDISPAADSVANAGGQSAAEVVAAAASTEPPRASSTSSQLSSSSKCANSRLFLDTTPEIFDGRVSRYKLWRSQFLNYVRSRTEASGSDKLVAMCKLLSGPPKDLICELPLSDNNYDVALKLLDENYDVPELRQQDVLANIVSVPQVRHPSDIAGLRDLLNVVQRTVLSLDAVGVSLQTIALPYEQTIRKALPINLVLNFEDRQQTDDLSASHVEGGDQAAAAASRLERLLAYLKRYTALRERNSSAIRDRVGDIGSHSTGDPRRTKAREAPRNPPPRNRSVYTAAATARRNHEKHVRRSPCLFCSDTGHRPSVCPADMPIHRRREILSQKRRCLRCFQFQHAAQQGCPGPKEACRHCNSSDHYSCMHESAPATSSERQRTAASVMQTVAAASTARAVVMTASAFVVHGDQRIRVRCFIDSGSMVSFVSTRLIERLPEIRPQARAELQLQAFASQHTVTVNRYAIQLCGTHADSDKIIVHAHGYNFDVDPPSNCSDRMRELIREFGKSHPLADDSIVDRHPDIEPDLLIGVDQMYKILHLNQELVIADGLIGKSSRLGWIVSGSFGPKTTRGDVVRVIPTCCPATLSRPAKDIERLWALEAIGVEKPKKELHNSADLEALRQFRLGLSYDGESYTVNMPKRDSILLLSNNLEIARNRLAAKRRSLAREPASFRRYHEEIMKFFQAGYAEEISVDDLAAPSSRNRTYYMPHRQVITQRETGDKWRIVFDCSAAAPGQTSLNSHLLTGPNLNPDIMKLLMNFRLRPVALSADVAQAYMTIRLAEEDRPYFRFLWQGPDDDRMRCFQMQRVTWGASPSGFLLAAVLREHFRRVDLASTYDLGSSFYFDDMLCSFDNEQEAKHFIEALVPGMRRAGMTLGKWKSNSDAVSGHIRRLTSSCVHSGLVQTGLLRVLGVAWSPLDDEFQFHLSTNSDLTANSPKVTKRNILRIVASIFDPVGWLIPFTVRGKLIIQQLWTSALRWDEPVTGPLSQSFLDWIAEIPDLASLRIPRLYGDPRGRPIAYQLHVFADASERAYAAVAYLQTLYTDGGSRSALVMSKSRLSPKDKISLPRLELMAALIAARLRKFIVDRLNVKIERVTHYTDSAVTFHWCVAKDPMRWKTFVCNRVTEIQELSSPSEWFHLPGKFNIADIASRGVSARDLSSNTEWWCGPPWLAEPEGSRPANRLRPGSDRSDSISEELRSAVAPVVETPELIDLERFGSWEKAVRVLANVLRFVCRCRRKHVDSDAKLRSQAEVFIIRAAQAAHFSLEIAATRSQERPTRSSKLSAFRLLLDSDGLLRAHTRLSHGSQLTFDERYPVIIPSEGRLAALLVLHHHRVNAHLGVGAVLSSLRRRFWILRGRQVIRKFLRACVACRRVHGPAADQVQAPLPADRASIVAPFAVAAVDFCGPFHTRSREGTCKNYIALFTCASVRAIHLELVPDLTTLQTHLALRRFLAENPACRAIISDNGRSFVRASADIRRLFNSFRDAKVREVLAQHRVEWSFNCPFSSWRGGLFERLIGVTKQALRKTLGRSLISAEELRTILRELSAVINNRPLSYISDDPNEPQALTPSQFLRGGPAQAPLCAMTPLDVLGPNGSLPTDPPEAERLRQSLLQRTNYFRSLCNRWQRDYLLLLRSANLDNNGRARDIQDGSVCLLRDDNVPRSKWNLVRVLQGHPGRDGALRTYSVRFSNGHESRRAAQSLIPLEVPDRDNGRDAS